MPSFVTGATGFIGRHLVQRLLAREETVHVLVRPSSLARLDALSVRWEGGERIRPVVGDLTQPLLGLDEDRIAELRGTIEHFFHLAAVYDMTADEEANVVANVEGTAHAVALANELEAGCFHHVSSIAVAGSYDGVFTEEMFDEGQPLDHPYHRTKFEAERIVRSEPTLPWRVYRPAVVVGDSQTGEMDKVDGPYYFFKLIRRLGGVLPQWLPLVAPELGDTNVVPVDYVADAIDHIAHQPGLDGRAFHLVNPRPQRAIDVVNAFARAAHAPRLALEVDGALTQAPSTALALAMRLPGARTIRRALLGELGIPDQVVEHIGLVPRFDAQETQRVLAGSGIEVPPLEEYAGRLWEYWEHHLDPDRMADRPLRSAVEGRTILITGASSGIGRAAALKLARAGGIVLLVARRAEKLEETKREIVASGGTAYIHPADVSDPEDIERLVKEVVAQHGGVDVLVNNAGRSIRRSIALSYERFHDFERTIDLNYLGAVKLLLELLPQMRARKRGHVVNVSSIGVQTSPPRFAAYVASKAALDAFTRVVASETIADGVTFTTIHMPLVRTPMIAPTKLYDAFPTISPDEAADLICEAIREKPKTIDTRLGRAGEVAYALAPKAVDQLLHLAYRVFPDSAAARGDASGVPERASAEQRALAHLTRGVHW